MRGKSAISSWQLAVLLFLSRIMQFFLAVSPEGQPGALTAALLLPASMAASILLLLPAYFLLRKNRGKGILDLAGERWGKLGAICSAAFFFFSLCVLVQTASAFSYFLTSTAYPDTSPWLFILLLFAVGGYAASMGYEPTARFGAFVFAALIAALLFTGFSLWPQAHWAFLRPPAGDSLQSQLQLFARLTLGNVETAALLFLIPAVNEKQKSVFWKWNLLTFGVGEGAILFTAAVLGDYGKSQRFPFYTVTKIAEVSIFQRLDSLHIALWVFMALVRLAVFLEVGGKSLARLLPTRAAKHAVATCAAVAALLSGVFTGQQHVLERIGSVFSSGAPVLWLTCLLPLFLLIFRRKGGAGR
ncbi:MAG: GerAB/ArcD/ProY family transporter [Oscillospiraceae bacterium]|nr:GerAB/ArcD/ProY family transporter [Oscillospiraceae bacterium]